MRSQNLCMPDLVFGRTNEPFPSIWLQLSVPHGGFDQETSNDLIQAAKDSGLPIDISTQPALWGGGLRGGQEVLMQTSTLQIESATSEDHATDLVQAHLIETLSCLGRDCIDFYFLRIRRNLEEYQINGALAAMEMAKQEGHIRFLGLHADGPALAVLGVWQFHDAFEAVMVPRNHYDLDTYNTLAPMAKDRRVGLLGCKPLDWGWGLSPASLPRASNLALALVQDLIQNHPTLVTVRSVADIQRLVKLLENPSEAEIYPSVDSLVKAFDEESTWKELETSPDPYVRRSARLRAEELALYN